MPVSGIWVRAYIYVRVSKREHPVSLCEGADTSRPAKSINKSGNGSVHIEKLLKCAVDGWLLIEVGSCAASEVCLSRVYPDMFTSSHPWCVGMHA